MEIQIEPNRRLGYGFQIRATDGPVCGVYDDEPLTMQEAMETLGEVMGRNDKPFAVHRVIVSCQRADAERIAAKWAHGPAWVECIEPGQLLALAERFSGGSEAGSWRRSWSPSKGLIRS